MPHIFIDRDNHRYATGNAVTADGDELYYEIPVTDDAEADTLLERLLEDYAKLKATTSGST